MHGLFYPPAAVKRLLCLLLLCKIGYVASEAVTPFRMIEKGFKREWFGFFALAEFPFEVIVCAYDDVHVASCLCVCAMHSCA